MGATTPAIRYFVPLGVNSSPKTTFAVNRPPSTFATGAWHHHGWPGIIAWMKITGQPSDSSRPVRSSLMSTDAPSFGLSITRLGRRTSALAAGATGTFTGTSAFAFGFSFGFAFACGTT